MVQDKLCGKLALHYAVESGQAEVAECLCRHDPNMLKIMDRFDKTPLSYAVPDSAMAIILENLALMLEPGSAMVEVEPLICGL